MGGINCITLSNDETQVLTVGQEKRISFWDLREHNPIRVTNLTEDMSDEALCVAVSHSGKIVATGGTAQLLKLWDFEMVTLLATGVRHSGTINDLKFSPVSLSRNSDRTTAEKRSRNGRNGH